MKALTGSTDLMAFFGQTSSTTTSSGGGSLQMSGTYAVWLQDVVVAGKLDLRPAPDLLPLATSQDHVSSNVVHSNALEKAMHSFPIKSNVASLYPKFDASLLEDEQQQHQQKPLIKLKLTWSGAPSSEEGQAPAMKPTLSKKKKKSTAKGEPAQKKTKLN